MWCVWAAKGGSGCSVVAATLALLSARQGPTLLVDLAGDLPTMLGLDEDRSTVAEVEADAEVEVAGPTGVIDWLAADRPPPDALGRLEVPVVDGLTVIARGGSPLSAPPRSCRWGHEEAVGLLAHLLAADARRVIVDVGVGCRSFGPIIERSSASILVTRPCYLSLRRAHDRPRPDRVVLIREQGRALRPSDVSDAIGTPVDSVAYDPAVARAVDAGTLATRLPRTLRVLGRLVATLATTAPAGEVSLR